MEATQPKNPVTGVKNGGLWGRFGRGVAVAVLALAVVGGTLWYLRPRRVDEASLPVSALAMVDGRLMVKGETNHPFTGWMTEMHAGGGMKSRSHIASGLLHGVSEGWFTNGIVQVREHFVEGIAEGSVSKWHSDGTRLSEGVARQGKLEGTFHRWHANGRMAEEVTLRAGVAHGISKSWFPSGHLRAEVELEEGKVVNQKFWEDGERPGIAATSNGGTGK